VDFIKSIYTKEMKKMRLTAKRKLLITILIITLTSFFAIPFTSFANSESIKTTDKDGSVNANIYDAKGDVYVRSDGLAQGSYWIRVMQPKNTVVLGVSADPTFVVDADGNLTGSAVNVVERTQGNKTETSYIIKLTRLVEFGDSANGEYKVEVSNDYADWKSKSDNFRIKGDPELTLVKSVKLASESSAPFVEKLTVGVSPAAVQYEYAVTNTGNLDIASVGIHDGTIQWDSSASDAQDIPVGETKYFYTDYTINFGDSSEFVNTATAGGFFEDTSVGSNESSAKVTYEEPKPKLTIDKTVKKADTNTNFADVLNVSTTSAAVEYQFVVKNEGNVGISDVGVYDQTLEWSSAGNNIYLPPGGSYTFTKDFTITNWIDDKFVNTASAGGIYGDKSVTSDTDTATVNYDADFVPKLGLTIEKTVRVANADTGTVDNLETDSDTITVEYEFHVINNSNVELTDVFVSDAAIGYKSGKVDLAANGGDEYFRYVFQIKATDWDENNQFINWAGATGTYDREEVNSKLDDATVTNSQPVSGPAILLDKLVNGANTASVSDRGTTVTYTFTVTNKGDVMLYEVFISDAAIGLIDGTALRLGDITPGSIVTTSASFDLSNLNTAGYGIWSGDTFKNTAYVYGSGLNPDYNGGEDSEVVAFVPQERPYIVVSDDDDATVTYSTSGGDDGNNNRRRAKTTTVAPEPTPAAPVVETPLIEESIPAAPLPKTGGVAPYLVYGLGLLLAGGGLAFRKKENKDK
jgi:LPXTG-motif cell wall-anchored protein